MDMIPSYREHGMLHMDMISWEEAGFVYRLWPWRRRHRRRRHRRRRRPLGGVLLMDTADGWTVDWPACG
jgi:hypothetical protein